MRTKTRTRPIPASRAAAASPATLALALVDLAVPSLVTAEAEHERAGGDVDIGGGPRQRLVGGFGAGGRIGHPQPGLRGEPQIDAVARLLAVFGARRLFAEAARSPQSRQSH